VQTENSVSPFKSPRPNKTPVRLVYNSDIKNSGSKARLERSPFQEVWPQSPLGLAFDEHLRMIGYGCGDDKK
jgi:hypothetical protein